MNRLRTIGLTVFVLIVLFCLAVHPGKIETDLSAAAADRLNKHGFGALDVVFDGRDATLKGSVASVDRIQSALAVLRALDGVRVIKNELTLDAPVRILLPPVAVVPALPVSPPPAAPAPLPVSAVIVPPVQVQNTQTIQLDLDRLLVGKQIEFHYNRMALRPSSRALLNEVAGVLKNTQAYRLEIGGHTDASGTRASNLKLSQQRAEVVFDYLVAHGLDAQQLTVRGYGEAYPVADNRSAKGRGLNRRVEFKVLEDEQ